MTPNPKHIEEVGLNAWPALQTNFFDGWILRLANGYTKRANSITPLYESNLLIEEKIDYCETFFRQQHQPTIFRLPSFHPDTPALDDKLEQRNYSAIDETSVQVADLTCTDLTGADFERSERVQDMLHPAHWLPTYHRLDCSRTDSDTHEQMLKNIVNPAAYFVLMVEGQSVACGLGVCQGGYVGLFDIVVDADQRRKGYGLEVINSLLAWGMAHGATTAYLQVVADNGPAIGLYERLGFEEIYRYHYRVKASL